MGILDAKALRDDIIARLLTDEVDLETSAYLDRILELAEMEEAEHQFLNDPLLIVVNLGMLLKKE